MVPILSYWLANCMFVASWPARLVEVLERSDLNR
jgi:hypothetical protein